MINKNDLTIELIEPRGYFIKNKGQNWIKQIEYVPCPILTGGKLNYQKSAEAHIDELIAQTSEAEAEKTTQEARLENLEDAIMALMMK